MPIGPLVLNAVMGGHRDEGPGWLSGLRSRDPCTIPPPHGAADNAPHGEIGRLEADMQALLTVMVTWLSINFGLPAIYEHPSVEFVTTEQMLDVRLAGASEATQAASASDAMPEVYAVYDDASGTIYLPIGWTPESPSDVSMLLHELVHHLQAAGGMTYACEGEREKPAYRAQARWLEQVDATLEGEFGLDPMTILVRTNCMF